VLGGGGYVLPRYLERLWPKGTVDVVEIDPGVTKAAIAAFELDPNTKINTFNLDARNYIDELNRLQQKGQQTNLYDFIYEDALDHYTIPWQLTTKQFNDRIYSLLSDDGIYMVELIDTFDSALFLGAYINTLEKTFPFVSVISQKDVKPWDRCTFVVIASRKALDLSDVCRNFDINRYVWYLDESQIAQAREKSDGMVLTDDYAPVENLTGPVYLRNIEFRGSKLAEQARKYASRGDLKNTMKKLEVFAEIDPSTCVREYGLVALIFAEGGRTDDAIKIFGAALDKFTDAKYKDQMPMLLYNYAAILKGTGYSSKSAELFAQTAKICNELILENPKSVEPYRVLGNVFAENGDFAKAIEYFKKAMALEPDNPENSKNLIQALEVSGDVDSAIKAAQEAITHFQSLNRPADVQNFRNYLQQLQSQRPAEK
jgi:tetratricopeptide (TPR) repeat protein